MAHTIHAYVCATFDLVKAMSTRMYRIRQMYDLISRGPYPTREQLQQKFEVSQRTVFLDIQFMKEVLGMDIEYDSINQVYFNKNPKKSFPAFDLSDEEIRALKLSTRVLSQYTGSAFEQVLFSALTKISDRLPDETAVKEEAKKDVPLSFKAAKGANLTIRHFWELNEACLNQYSVRIEYSSPKSDERSSRKIDPYRIIERNGNWYVIAYCHLRKGMRIFALQRIKDLDVLNETFEKRPEFNEDELLDSAFQIEVGAEKFTAKIRFSPLAARYIREKTWHPSQVIHENGDGSIVMSFIASSLDEVKRWVMFYGSEAEVLEPPALRELVAGELNLALKKYS